MISTELANLSDYLLGHATKRLRLAPSASIHLAHVLLDLSRQVAALENVPLRLDSPEVRLGFHHMHEAHDAE